VFNRFEALGLTALPPLPKDATNAFVADAGDTNGYLTDRRDHTLEHALVTSPATLAIPVTWRA
jgi:hypothetical protein